MPEQDTDARSTRPPTFEVITHREPDGSFWVEAPGIPGLVTQGETKEELVANLQEAFEGWLLTADPEEAARLGIAPTPPPLQPLELVEEQPVRLTVSPRGWLSVMAA